MRSQTVAPISWLLVFAGVVMASLACMVARREWKGKTAIPMWMVLRRREFYSEKRLGFLLVASVADAVGLTSMAASIICLKLLTIIHIVIIHYMLVGIVLSSSVITVVSFLFFLSLFFFAKPQFLVPPHLRGK